jgi:signal transduction histidine kinase/DNA-binding NarL/FixJ family response regulator
MAEVRQQVTPTRVLLVEDNPGDADLVEISLGEADGGPFETEHVTTLSEALARVARSPGPDVVLLDLSLPDALGLEGLRRLKEAAPDVPVVVLTGSANREIGGAAIHAGAQDYLSKGADSALVPRALRYAIERHEHAGRARLLAEEQAARAAAEAARERMAVLAAASNAVSHSLEDRHALTSLASALVPRFADWCAVRTAGAEQEIAGWFVAHHDAGAAAAVSARLDAVLAEPEARCGPAAVAASGQAELVDDVSASSPPSPWKVALEGLAARSAIVAPVRLIDEVLGVIVFAASRRTFDRDDLALAEEIGRRAGVAIANCRLYREARLAVAARDEFLSVAAHELKTPIAVLQLKLQQVEMKQQASLCGTCEHAVPADYRGAARQISRLGHLVQGLLDVSRIVASGVKLEHEDFDVCDVAREAIERLADIATRSRSTIVLRCPEPVRGVWDRLALERVFGNLLSNALKFGAEKPVEVRIGTEGEHAVIEVEDHGIGIAPDDVDRIFDQFERAVSSRHFGGLGLGLYVTRRLVEQHGGSIAVASRPGSGSLFTVRLPRVVPRAA